MPPSLTSSPGWKHWFITSQPRRDRAVVSIGSKASRATTRWSHSDSVAGRVADLKVADPGAGELAPRRKWFDELAHLRLANALQHTRVDQEGQRHASDRSASSASASTSSAFETPLFASRWRGAGPD